MKNTKLSIMITAFAVLPSVHLFSQDNEKLIKDYISQNKIREYQKSDLANFIIENVDDSKSLNGNVVKFQQTYNGYPVYSELATIFETKFIYSLCYIFRLIRH